MAQITINIQTLDWTMGETVGLHLMSVSYTHLTLPTTERV